MVWGLVSGATWWFPQPPFLQLESGDDITTSHYYLEVQQGPWAFESGRIGSRLLERARGSLVCKDPEAGKNSIHWKHVWLGRNKDVAAGVGRSLTTWHCWS